MGTKNIKLYFFKKVILLLLPLYFLILLYILFDPFKIIYAYDFYYKEHSNIDVGLNRDNVSSSLVRKNIKNIDSYILGNSRSLAFRCNKWRKYLKINSNCFHFDASGETLYGILKKLEFLKENNAKISNVIIVLDHSVLEGIKSKSGHLYTISPITDGFIAGYKLHSESINAFFSFKFLTAYFKFKIFNQVDENAKINRLISDNIHYYDQKSNEIQFRKFDSLIEVKSYYNDSVMKKFYKRLNEPIVLKKIIKREQNFFLYKIKYILESLKADYRIVISPLYDQLYLDNSDNLYLKSLFGNKYYNFSGINKITSDYNNYYEDSHYRPVVADWILDSIYKK